MQLVFCKKKNLWFIVVEKKKEVEQFMLTAVKIRILYGRYDRPLWSTSYDDGDFGAHVEIRGLTLAH